MAISDAFLQELRSRVDIESLISPYVNLRRRGRLYTGLCPFHNEKTPSFTVYPDSQSFYCFGCGAGGEIITFIRRIENLDFVEAVKVLAERAGLPMPEDGYDDSLMKKRRAMLEANREAARFFHETLCGGKGQKALRYLTNRGLSRELITRFGLGFAPDSWDALLGHMKQKGFSARNFTRPIWSPRANEPKRFITTTASATVSCSPSLICGAMLSPLAAGCSMTRSQSTSTLPTHWFTKKARAFTR